MLFTAICIINRKKYNIFRTWLKIALITCTIYQARGYIAAGFADLTRLHKKGEEFFLVP